MFYSAVHCRVEEAVRHLPLPPPALVLMAVVRPNRAAGDDGETLGPMVGGAQWRPGCRHVRRPAEPEGAAGESRARAAVEAPLAPAAGSRGCPALFAGEPMAQARPTGLT